MIGKEKVPVQIVWTSELSKNKPSETIQDILALKDKSLDSKARLLNYIDSQKVDRTTFFYKSPTEPMVAFKFK